MQNVALLFFIHCAYRMGNTRWSPTLIKWFMSHIFSWPLLRQYRKFCLPNFVELCLLVRACNPLRPASPKFFALMIIQNSVLTPKTISIMINYVYRQAYHRSLSCWPTSLHGTFQFSIRIFSLEGPPPRLTPLRWQFRRDLLWQTLLCGCPLFGIC